MSKLNKQSSQAGKASTASLVTSPAANPDATISLSKSNRMPTLPEKMTIVNKWFASCCTLAGNKNYKQADVEIEVIADLLVAKQLVSDTDTGIKLIVKSLNIRDTETKELKLNYALFQRIFCRSIFKESLIEVLREIEDGVTRQRKQDFTQQGAKSPRAAK